VLLFVCSLKSQLDTAVFVNAHLSLWFNVMCFETSSPKWACSFTSSISLMFHNFAFYKSFGYRTVLLVSHLTEIKRTVLQPAGDWTASFRFYLNLTQQFLREQP